MKYSTKPQIPRTTTLRNAATVITLLVTGAAAFYFSAANNRHGNDEKLLGLNAQTFQGESKSQEKESELVNAGQKAPKAIPKDSANSPSNDIAQNAVTRAAKPTDGDQKNALQKNLLGLNLSSDVSNLSSVQLEAEEKMITDYLEHGDVIRKLNEDRVDEAGRRDLEALFRHLADVRTKQINTKMIDLADRFEKYKQDKSQQLPFSSNGIQNDPKLQKELAAIKSSLEQKMSEVKLERSRVLRDLEKNKL